VPWRVALPLAATLVLAALVVPFVVRDEASGGSDTVSRAVPDATDKGGTLLPPIAGDASVPTRNVGLENLLRDQQDLAAELESLRRSVDDERHVIYLEGNASADIVIDLSSLVELIEKQRAAPADEPSLRGPPSFPSRTEPRERGREPAPGGLY